MVKRNITISVHEDDYLEFLDYMGYSVDENINGEELEDYVIEALGDQDLELLYSCPYVKNVDETW